MVRKIKVGLYATICTVMLLGGLTVNANSSTREKIEEKYQMFYNSKGNILYDHDNDGTAEVAFYSSDFAVLHHKCHGVYEQIKQLYAALGEPVPDEVKYNPYKDIVYNP